VTEEAKRRTNRRPTSALSASWSTRWRLQRRGDQPSRLARRKKRASPRKNVSPRRKETAGQTLT